MRTFLPILLVFMSLSGCSDKKVKDADGANNLAAGKPISITAVDAAFPLWLISVELRDTTKIFRPDISIILKLDETIKEYARETSVGDSTLVYKDVYINTIRLKDSLQTVFLILLRHYPSGNLNSRVLIFNNERKDFVKGYFDFNLHAMYNYADGNLQPTNLKKEFQINLPEIRRADKDNDGIPIFTFTRLVHNGTFNAIQTTFVTISNNQIDVMGTHDSPVGNK